MRIWAVIVASLCSLAHAAWEEQFSGLWISPALPGWAASIHHQGDHAVATLLTYGPDGKAKWYQTPDLGLPQWNPYILWGTVNLAGDLLEGGSSRSAGSVNFIFDEDQAAVRYVVDGIAIELPITRFLFAPAGLQGGFAGTWRITPYGSCRGSSATESVRITASNAPDNAVGLVFTTATATCMALGAFGYFDSTPQVEGGAQCTGLGGIATSKFAATDLHVARDTLSFQLTFYDGDCGYYGSVAAARTDKLPDDHAPPHDDVGGLWKTGHGWSIDAHLQGNTLFATVLAADGSWFVAPDARYLTGQDGDFVEYGGDLWSVSKTRPTDREYHVAPAGIMVLTSDELGYNSVGYGTAGATTPATRKTWPRDDSIAGSYAGVRSDLLVPSPSFVTGGLEISEAAGITRITMGNSDSDRCEFSGQLQWNGPTARMYGTSSCREGQATRSGAFTADQIRITDQGITLRYWANGTFGAIAGVRR